MNTSSPLVSVVIPVYNVEQYICSAIQSVLDQSYENFELLLIDDGSPDYSVTLAKSFCDSRITIISQQNRGLAGARNTGIHAACGKYIALLDADDLWAPNKLELHVKHLESRPEIDISYCPSLFMDEEDQLIGLGQFPKLTDISNQEILCRNPVGNGSAAVIRKSLTDKIRQSQEGLDQNRIYYFDERLRQSEDIEFWLRCALSFNAKFEGISEPLTYYRLNQDGLSANLEKQLESWYVAMSLNRDTHPNFFQQYFSLAEAYQLRYLARRAIHSGMQKEGLSFSKKALKANLSILFQEPKRTISTLACALLLRHCTSLFNWCLKHFLPSEQKKAVI